MVTFIQVAIYGLVVWLGCYLIARDLSSWRLRFAGLALISYGVNVALAMLYTHISDSGLLLNLRLTFFFIPPIFWFATVWESIPEHRKYEGNRAKFIIRYGLLVMIGVVLISNVITNFPSSMYENILYLADEQPPNTSNYDFRLLGFQFPIFIVISFGLVFLSLSLTWRYVIKDIPKPLKNLFALSTLFFTLGYIAFWVSTEFLLFISADFLMFGAVIVIWDAMDAGESLLPDMLRSFTSSFLMVLIVVGQVLVIVPNITDTTLILILALITTIILVFVFEIPIQNGLDTVIFSRFPTIRQQRKNLRVAENIIIRRAENPALFQDESEFIRLTRRAISSYGDLTKLATSPLTHLPIIQHRLVQRNAHDDTLERAKELKALLTESIMRLKPNGADFGTSDEWRHYNALYFPYVVGLKPYRLRVFADDLDGAYRDALTWFRSQVPERTLYNWQNAAAMLIAQDLRERK